MEEYTAGAEERWRTQSAETMQLETRLCRAQSLVACLEQTVQPR